jgi:hypothetical protein
MWLSCTHAFLRVQIHAAGMTLWSSRRLASDCLPNLSSRNSFLWGGGDDERAVVEEKLCDGMVGWGGVTVTKVRWELMRKKGSETLLNPQEIKFVIHIT